MTAIDVDFLLKVLAVYRIDSLRATWRHDRRVYRHVLPSFSVSKKRLHRAFPGIFTDGLR